MDLISLEPGLFIWTIFSGLMLVLFIIAIRRLLIDKTMENKAKVGWLLVILFFPIIGSLVYLNNRKPAGHKR